MGIKDTRSHASSSYVTALMARSRIVKSPIQDFELESSKANFRRYNESNHIYGSS